MWLLDIILSHLIVAPACVVDLEQMKPYRNLYIFILSHPKNGAIAGIDILSRINYIDKMTRDVTFIMPGYKRAIDNDLIVNDDKNMQLTFDEDVFIDAIKTLEDKSNGQFSYKDNCELLFINSDVDGQYDFSNMSRLDLNLLAKNYKIDPIQLIMTVAHRFRESKENIDINNYVTQILNELLDNNPIVRKVFIAGAKKLNRERALLREELNKIENNLNLDIRSLTFEDFPMSLTGKNQGRQADYNKFIQVHANVVIFIFDLTAGAITKEEFDIAYDSLIESKHPEIYVFVRKRNKLLTIFLEHKIKDIKQRVFTKGKEYYVEYKNYDNLRYLFYKAMTDYFKKESAQLR